MLLVAAAAAVPPYLTDVCALLVVAAAVAYACHRLGLTPLVGFLLAGVLIGPKSLGLVRNQAVVEAAADLGSRYVPDPPLVQAENIRIKLARLAVAFAARTFSTNARGELLIVRKSHVKAAVEFLDMVYGTDAMGYKSYSMRVLRDIETAQFHMKACRKYLRNNPVQP